MIEDSQTLSPHRNFVKHGMTNTLLTYKPRCRKTESVAANRRRPPVWLLAVSGHESLSASSLAPRGRTGFSDSLREVLMSKLIFRRQTRVVGHFLSGLLITALLFGAGSLPLRATTQAIQAPVLKWQKGGCYSSWCETGWYSSPAVADLDGDGTMDVIGSAYTLFVLNGKTGVLEWSVASGHDRSQPGAGNVGRTWPGIVVADVDGDGQSEIVAVHSGGYVSVYNSAGYFKPGWPQRPITNELRGLSVYDLDGDGKMEIIVTGALGSSTNTWVYQHDGHSAQVGLS